MVLVQSSLLVRVGVGWGGDFRGAFGKASYSKNRCQRGLGNHSSTQKVMVDKNFESIPQKKHRELSRAVLEAKGLRGGKTLNAQRQEGQV